MMLTETSLDSYKIIKEDLGERQKIVYDAISILFEPNNLDLSKWLNLPINSITPRVNELMKKGLIKVAGQKHDIRTNRFTNFYTII